MGYYIHVTEVQFTIPKKNLDTALSIVKDLNTNPRHAEHKRSGSTEQRTYAWMPVNYHETVTSAKEVFELLGFETELNDHGLALTYYDDKAGNEDLFLSAVSGLVDPGSYIEWAGDDGEQWRLDFNGESMTHRVGQTVFI